MQYNVRITPAAKKRFREQHPEIDFGEIAPQLRDALSENATFESLPPFPYGKDMFEQLITVYSNRTEYAIRTMYYFDKGDERISITNLVII